MARYPTCPAPDVPGTVVRVGRRSRGLTFEARVVCRARPGAGPSAAQVLTDPVVCTRATGTVVVPEPPQPHAP